MANTMQQPTWKETFTLWWIALKVFWKKVLEAVNIALFYYLRSWSFMREDLALLAAYWQKSPYRISSEFWENQGAPELEIFGETPLTTLDLIATSVGINKEDCVYELGCGRGRTCFWLRKFVGCEVIGIEFIPEFVEKAKEIQKKHQIEGLTFRQGDFLECNFENASILYLYGTTMEEESICLLIGHLSKLPTGTRIITVSYPLNDFCEDLIFKIEKKMIVPFLWGNAEVYVQRIAGIAGIARSL